jgi:hypothetical protein
MDTDCPDCHGTGIVPCPWCDDIDDHTCHADGEEYGPYPCSCGAGSDA